MMKKNNRDQKKPKDFKDVKYVKEVKDFKKVEDVEDIDDIEEVEEVEDVEDVENVKFVKDVKEVKNERVSKGIKIIKGFFHTKTFKYGASSIVMVIAVVLCLLFLNMMVDKFVDTQMGIKWDLTPEKRFTLGETTNKLLKGLKDEVTVYFLIDYKEIASSDFHEIAKQYERFDKVKVVYKDMEKNPSLLQEIDPNSTLKDVAPMDVVVKKGTRLKLIKSAEFQTQDQMTGEQGFAGEQMLSGAIKYVTSEKVPTVYFTQGHNEIKLDTEMPIIKSFLSTNSYESKALNLTKESKVPDDCSILIVASPKIDLTIGEKDALKKYMETGGKLYLMFDSLTESLSLKEFGDFLKDYNLALGNNRIKENEAGKFVSGDNYTFAATVEQNDINADFFNYDQTDVALSKVMSINQLKNKNENLTITSLLKSSKSSIGEPLDKATGKEETGPLTIGYSVESKITNARLIVLGSSSLMNDTMIQRYKTGMYFFVSNFSWGSNKKEQIDIDPKLMVSTQIQMSQLQVTIVQSIVIGILPLLILGVGTTVWLKRRHL